MKITQIFWLLLVGATARGAGGAAALEVDRPHSQIEVAVSSTVDSFVGKLERYQVRVEWDPTTALPAQADVSFDFADLKTGNPARDAAMLKWLDYTTNRIATFHLTGWQQAGATNVALGRLTMHGVSAGVQLPTVVQPHGQTWEISGTARFDYRDFKLPKIRKLLVLTVDPQLQVSFHLAGKFPAGK